MFYAFVDRPLLAIIITLLSVLCFFIYDVLDESFTVIKERTVVVTDKKTVRIGWFRKEFFVTPKDGNRLKVQSKEDYNNIVVGKENSLIVKDHYFCFTPDVVTAVKKKEAEDSSRKKFIHTIKEKFNALKRRKDGD